MPHDLQIYPGYTEDELKILTRFEIAEAAAEPGFIVDFIGVRTRITSVWPGARTLDNTLVGLPVPADFHAEAIEWIGMLKSVAAAADRFVVMELGAGYGTWCVASAVAARSRGIGRIKLYGVEGDPQHFATMVQHCRDNGFAPEEQVLMQAAVGVAIGTALWPKVDDTSDIWGFRPILAGQTDYTGRIYDSTIEVQVLSMVDLVQREPVWDLVHIDVQGDEFEICKSCIDLLNERVRWIIVGTHSRKLDGDMLDLMFRASWILENEKPTRFTFTPGAPTMEAMTVFDGTQVWRNPRLG